MRIKRFKLKDGVTRDKLLSLGFTNGGSWVFNEEEDEADVFRSFYFYKEDADFNVSVSIAFRKNIYDWDDFSNVLVLHEDFCQPYTPFYDYFNSKEIPSDFKALEFVVEKYNELMSSLPFLVEDSKVLNSSENDRDWKDRYFSFLASLTCVTNGKQQYFEQEDGRVYSRISGKYLTVDEMEHEFIYEMEHYLD